VAQRRYLWREAEPDKYASRCYQTRKRIALICLIFSACNNKVSLELGSTCAKTTDCQSGLLCDGGRCITLQADGDTPSAFSISQVQGDATNAAGNNFVNAALIISGAGFDALPAGWSVRLADAAGLMAELLVTDASATTLRAALPASLALQAATYTLTVLSVSSGQSVSREVSIVTGPPGADGLRGPTGPTPELQIFAGVGATVSGDAVSGFTIGVSTPLELSSGVTGSTGIALQVGPGVADFALGGVKLPTYQASAFNRVPDSLPAFCTSNATAECCFDGCGCDATTAAQQVVATCNLGDVAISGGCAAGTTPAKSSTPFGTDGWRCRWAASDTSCKRAIVTCLKTR